MDARLFVDVDCSRAGRPCWTWHQNRNSPCASVSEDGRGFVLVALQHQISLVPVRSCCSIRRLFWRFVFRKLANWSRLYPNSNLIGLSRMYIGAHYLSDVVCAAILGILCALLVAHFLLRQIANRQ